MLRYWPHILPPKSGIEETNKFELVDGIRCVQIKLLWIDQTSEHHDDDICRAQKKTSTALNKTVRDVTTMTSHSHIGVSPIATQTVTEDGSYYVW